MQLVDDQGNDIENYDYEVSYSERNDPVPGPNRIEER